MTASHGCERPHHTFDAEITSLSCASATHCTAGGYYPHSLGGGFGSEEAFVVNET